MAKQKEPAPQPLLDLDTLSKRPFIRIDGKHYDLRSPGELDILTFHTIATKARAVDRLFAGHDSADGGLEDLDEESIRLVADALDAVCGAIFVDIPEDVYRRLSETQKLRVMTVFSELQKAPTPRLPAGTETSGAKPRVAAATGAK